ncbi:hypothetical protein NL108_013057 [Boleophthalmus pectinirostris]|nr:hypothetical protein NL108_013057 [Boleophthalmus pectinirostris]
MSNTNLPPRDLNELYNTGVQSAEWVARPKQGMPFTVPLPSSIPNPTTHSGVRVTLNDGQKFLIHKGPEFGKASETVITDAKHMSDKWQVQQTREFGGTRTVGDFVKTGGENYSVIRGQHCHRAAKDMMNQN